jgi:hypothetical protein
MSDRHQPGTLIGIVRNPQSSCLPEFHSEVWGEERFL